MAAADPAQPFLVEDSAIPLPEPSPRRRDMPVAASIPLPEKKPTAVKHDADQIAELVLAYAASATGDAKPHLNDGIAGSLSDRSLPAFLTALPDVIY